MSGSSLQCYIKEAHIVVFSEAIIIILKFIDSKIDINPLMSLIPRRERPGTDMGRHLKSTRQGITKVGYASLNK